MRSRANPRGAGRLRRWQRRHTSAPGTWAAVRRPCRRRVLEYQQRLRLSYARHLLSDSEMPLERVAELSNFGSARDLRRVWSRFEDGSPGDLRRHH